MPKRSWIRFLEMFGRDVKLWLYCVALLQTNRLLFIFLLRGNMDPQSGWDEVAAAAMNGLRFDAAVAGYVTCIPVIFSLVCGFADIRRMADRVRTGMGIIYTALFAVLSVVNYGYFQEFHNVFDGFLFNFYYDDTKAILSTIRSGYHLAPSLLVMVTVTGAGQYLLRRFLYRDMVSPHLFSRMISSSWTKVSLSALVIPFLYISTGAFGSHPAKRSDAGITTDDFINKSILNPFIALHYAVKEYRLLSGADGLEEYLPDRDIAAAARRIFPEAPSFEDVDSAITRFASGPKGRIPRHIFIVMEESYDAWPLLPRYASLGLTGSFRELAKAGRYVEHFLPASEGTMTSLAVIMTGLADAGVYTNYQRTAERAFPSSAAEIFKRLGYRTRFFYGGYATWQRVDDFARAQGFEERYNAPSMGRWISTNAWGVDDGHLFAFVLSKAPPEPKSFNFILTTTYHPPYSIDVYGKGFPVREAPPDLRAMWDNKTVDLQMLGHLWYTDRELGVFVRTMDSRAPDALFAITGDHYGRKFIGRHPDFFERSAVPLLLYGPSVLTGISLPPNAAGSHLDIVPTLVELCAPPGFAYHSLGTDLFVPRERFLGLGRGKIISHDFIAELGDTPRFHPLPGRELPAVLPDIQELKRFHDAVHGLSWWRIKQGKEFPVIAIP